MLIDSENLPCVAGLSLTAASNQISHVLPTHLPGSSFQAGCVPRRMEVEYLCIPRATRKRWKSQDAVRNTAQLYAPCFPLMFCIGCFD